MDIIVLGCGPAGLMAAQGALDAGAESIRIISKKRKSELFGAQYLHAPIPGVTADGDERTVVRYTLMGEPDEYRAKVYGRTWDGTVSPEDLAESHEAWNIRDTYDRLWSTFSDAINDVEDITPAIIHGLLEPDTLLINSIPRPAICHEGHTFRAQQVWAAGDAPERGVRLPYQCAPDTVMCNGLENPSWYRLSNIFGYHTVEWSLESMPGKPPVGQPALVNKPTGHNCSCWGRGIVHVGRYGKWEKGVLSHTAYGAAAAAVDHALNDGIQNALPGIVL